MNWMNCWETFYMQLFHTRMNGWETFYMQLFHQHGTLINVQQVNDINPLYEVADTSRTPLHVRNSVARCTALSTHTTTW
jgi:hypothetical protein